MSLEANPTALARFQELDSSGAAPIVVAYLKRVIAEGSDFDCYKINAFRVSEETGVSRLDAVRTFLFATRLGLTDLTWDIHCPSCLGLPEFHRHLMQLKSRAHCSLCELQWDVALEDQVEVTFTINADMRRIPFEEFAETAWPGSAPVYTRRLSRDERLPNLASPLLPGHEAQIQGALGDGDYDCVSPGHPEGAARLRVSGPSADGQQIRLTLAADGTVFPRELSARPGTATFVIENHYAQPWGFAVRPIVPPKNWVSASYITGLQDFRDLFSGEFLAPDTAFAIKSTTLLFTDIKSSTEMYERLGDAAAYSLVQQHFHLMTEVIRKYEGGIVKTIGDAVMASFCVNRDAVLAAMEIQEGFAKVSPPLNEIEVKAGLHRGPAIAVTSNRMLDFFGRTVNQAARVQGESHAGEILLSEAVTSDPAVMALLEERGIATSRVEASLKGIAGKVPLTSIYVRPPRS